MNPNIAVFDKFLPAHLLFRRLHLYGDFKDVENPNDGVTYRGIAQNIDAPLIQFINQSLPRLVGLERMEEIEVNAMFARLMTHKHPASKIHADHLMGEFSLHVYLNRENPENAGTQFWRHEEYGDHFPEKINVSAREFVESCEAPNAWTRGWFVAARYNRALLHDSRLWHSAEPRRGFGESEQDGRLVLTTFFSRKVSK